MSVKSPINIVKDYSKFYEHYRPSYGSTVKFGEVSISLTESIVRDALEVFMEFVKHIGIFEISSYSRESQERDYTFINVWDEKNKKELLKTVIRDQKGNKSYEDNVYLIKYKSKEYIIGFYNDADELGFFNEHGNPETYLMCNIIKYGIEKKILYDVIFSFDIETMKFIELFEVGIEYSSISEDGLDIHNARHATNESIRNIEGNFAGMNLLEI